MSSDALRTGPAVAKMAVFVVVTLICTGLLAITITNADFSPKHTYSGVFSDAVGVAAGDDVRISGVRVGSVSGIELYENEHALVTFTVDRSVSLASSTKVGIRYRNLIGQRYLAVTEIAGDGEPLPAGSVIPLSHTTPALDLNALFNGFKPLLTALQPDQVNTLAFEIVRVLQGEGGTVTSLLSRISSLTGTIADRDALIGQVVDNLNAVLGPIDTHNRELSALIVNLQAFVSGLAEDREAIGSSFASISDLASTTAGLLEEGRPALKQDIASLGQLAAGLNTDESRRLIEYNLDEETGLGRKLELTMPLVSYGSWVNFYLCAVNFKLGPDVHTDSTPIMFNTSPRCEL